MRRNDKRGKFYVMLLCGIVICLLIAIYAKIVSYYATNELYGANKNIGEKQAYVLDAIREGERVNLYLREARSLAAAQTARIPSCTVLYLNAYPLVGRGSCTDKIGDTYQQQLGPYLAAYPGGLSDIIFDPPKVQHREVTLHGTKTIPIGTVSTVTAQTTAPPVPAAVTQTVPDPQTTTTSPDPSLPVTASTDPAAPKSLSEAPKEVQITYKRLSEEKLFPVIEQAAKENGISRELLLAIITQESKGDPKAVSFTGAVGLTQFTAATAKGSRNNPGFFAQSELPSIEACCTGEEVRLAISCAQQRSTTGACMNWDICMAPSKRDCPVTDARFNAESSVHAAARYLARIAKNYPQYEQVDAFIIAEYNGGTEVTKLAQKGGKKATWESVAAQLPAVVGAFKAQEIRGYVTSVRKWYVAWGGAGFIGTSFSSEELGRYDLAIDVSTTIPEGYATVLANIETAVSSCTTTDCVRGAVLTASHPSWLLVDPVLAGNALGTCTTPAEEAQLFLSRQFEQCKQSSGDECSCPLDGAIDATFTVSLDNILVTKIGSQTVDASTLPPQLGVDYLYNLEPAAQREVTWLRTSEPIPSDPVSAASRIDTGKKGVLTLARGEKPVIKLQYDILASAPAHTFTALYKRDGMLSFIDDPGATACIVPPAPAFYCMHDARGQEKPVLFSVIIPIASSAP